MSRRATIGANDSLELLLDTMCNAFGGIMFIAMLLAVLCEHTEVRQTETTSEAARRQQARRELVEAQINRLEHDLNRQNHLIEQTLGDGEDSIARLHLLQKENAALEQRVSDMRKTLADMNAQKVAARKLRMEMQPMLSAAVSAVACARDELARVRQGPVRSFCIATLRASKKPTFFIAIKWNRLYLLYTAKPSSQGRTINRGAVNCRRVSARAKHFSPIRGRGVPIDQPGWESSADVQSLLSHVSPADNSLQFVVFPDSYGTFGSARDFFRGKGYDWHWHIMPNIDHPVSLVTGGSGPGPQVHGGG